jgi:L-Ala-D/L-Glu epimerase
MKPNRLSLAIRKQPTSKPICEPALRICCHACSAHVTHMRTPPASGNDKVQHGNQRRAWTMALRDLEVGLKTWPLTEPFRIARMQYDVLEVLDVSINERGLVGRGEAAGVDYLGDSPASAKSQIPAVQAAIERGHSREDLHLLLKPGAARNAIDCALWDLECKLSGASVWELSQLQPRSLQTVATIGVASPAEMATKARQLAKFALLKLKLDANAPVDCVEAVRRARPDARLVVDVNTGWDVDTLQRVHRPLAGLGVELIEQPLPPHADACLIDFKSAVPLAADESCQTVDDLARLQDRYAIVNIKLDKCGGLTPALQLANRARAMGFGIMVGNMLGTSIAMAPAFVVGLLADWCDLDGPLTLTGDVPHGMTFKDGGWVDPPAPQLWG